MILGICVFALLAAIALSLIARRRRNIRRDLEQYSVTPAELHDAMNAGTHPLIYDVRLPLDLLADPNVIPDAHRIAPSELAENPSLIPREGDIVIYCTCPGDESSRLVIRKAHELQFFNVRFLRGGLAAWKASGYPVTPYEEAFRLDVGSGPSLLH